MGIVTVEELQETTRKSPEFQWTIAFWAEFLTTPVGIIEPSKLVDEDAEAVKQKAIEEKQEEDELQRVSTFDKPREIQREVEFGDGRLFEEEISEP